MTAPMSADLETGADESITPEISTDAPEQSLSSLLDNALDTEPSIQAEEGETPEQTKARIDRGDGRDATGKFVGKEKPPEAAAPPNPEATPETPAAPTKAPFRYRALGKTNDVPGSEIDDTGRITFAPAEHARLAQAFNALEVMSSPTGPSALIERHKQEAVQWKQRAEQAEQATTARDQQAGKLVEALTAAFSEPDEAKSLEMLWAMRQNFPLLLANAEREHWKAQAERAKQPAAPVAPQAEAPQAAGRSLPDVEEVKASAVELIEHWKISPEHRGISAEAWKHAEARAAAQPFAFLRPATADDAKSNPGIREGEIVFDRDLLFAEADQYAKRESAARETAAAQAKLAAKNAVRTQTSITAPPVAGGTQPPPKGGNQRFKTKEEYEAWKQSDEIDED